MPAEEASSLRTRPSFINRLKKEDVDGWNEFYRVYGKIVRDFALKAGLTAVEADDVVQETAIGVARNISGFEKRKECRFKTFLLTQASWRILDQLKRRKRGISGKTIPAFSEETGTPLIERVPDPHPIDLDALFESEWRDGLYTEALERIKEKFTLKQFQVFDLLVSKDWKAADVASSLGMSVTNVYVTRHRMSVALESEIRRLEKAFDKIAARQAAGG